MARRRKKRRFAAGRWGLVAAVAALALGIGFLGGYLWNDLRTVRRTARGPDTARIETVLGQLDPAGVRFRAANRGEAERLLARLRRAAGQSPGVAVGPVSRRDGRFDLTVAAGPERYPVTVLWPEPAERVPRLAIVIDDVGRNLDRAEAFLDLDVPVTLSILPRQRHSRDVADLLGTRGRAYLVHMPMEPQGYPSVDPGPGALLADMDEARIRALVRRHLDDFPGAVGVNNHMGSRLTELATPMGWVADELARRGLFFLDSVTSGRSVAAEVARARGLPWCRRDVFIDNDRTEDAIGKQLERAVQRARKNGTAVAIGHPYPVTLRTLRAWAPRFRQLGVTVVPIADVVRTGEG